MFYLYVLKSKKDSKFYIGCTSNLERRVYEHTNGMVISTKNRRPFELLYTERFKTKKEAENREKYFKGGGKARNLLTKLIKEKNL